jgi:hypothetical protein
MSEKDIEYKPSQWFLDDKDAKYYKNLYFNNNRLMKNTINRCYNHIISINNNINELLELESKKDPFLQPIKEIEEFKNIVDELLQKYEIISQRCMEDSSDLATRDYEKIISDNIDHINKKENN